MRGRGVLTGTPVRERLRRGVGESIARQDADPKVQGKFQYASDLWREGMLHGATLRSPYPFARIRKVDVSAAAKRPGVRAVLTQDDVPGKKTYGLMDRDDQPVLAESFSVTWEPMNPAPPVTRTRPITPPSRSSRGSSACRCRSP